MNLAQIELLPQPQQDLAKVISHRPSLAGVKSLDEMYDPETRGKMAEALVASAAAGSSDVNRILPSICSATLKAPREAISATLNKMCDQ